MAKKTASNPLAAKKTESAFTPNASSLFPPRPADITEFNESIAAGGVDYSSMLESICGTTDDSQPVEQYNGTLGVTQAFVNAHQSSVAQVQWNNDLATKYTSPGDVNGVRWGTGTMISPDLFLTAGHLFDQVGNGWTRPLDNTTGATISPQEIALNMHLNFNFQVDPSGTLRTEVSFPITELIEYRLAGLDFAICRIGGNPGTTFGTTGVSTVDGAVGDMLCIMGHPLGVPKRIEAGPLSSLSGSTLTYSDIDTQGGNSGSGILRASTGLIVGVHTNGGCTASGGANVGFRITSIRAASPTLQALPGPTNTILDNIHTTVQADLQPTTVQLDNPTTLVFVDNPPTNFVLDNPPTNIVLDNPTTLVFVDNPPTNVVIDNIRTNPVLDNPRTNPLLDNLRTDPLGDRAKAPASDNPTDPFDPVFDPVRRGGGVIRPFVLATPHHIPTPGGEAAALQGQYEQAIMQLAQAIEHNAGELVLLQQQYEQAVAEYRAMVSGQ